MPRARHLSAVLLFAAQAPPGELSITQKSGPGIRIAAWFKLASPLTRTDFARAARRPRVRAGEAKCRAGTCRGAAEAEGGVGGF